MKCKDCVFCWFGEHDKTPTCHYDYDDGKKPCKTEEKELENLYVR